MRPNPGLSRAVRPASFPIRKGGVWLRLFLILCFAGLPTAGGLANPPAQTPDPGYLARALLQQMTPAERVGQLFLVTFQGTQTDSTSQVYEMVTRLHVGGVVLLRKNNNFSNAVDLPATTEALTRALQNLAWQSSQPSDGAVQAPPRYIPLLIGIPEEGDNYPNDQMLSGVTNLPNLMSIGASWNRNLARQVGTALGEELSALGFNLLLGPSLDVIEPTSIPGGDDLGVRSFGGDPYWTSELGSEYIQGLHAGSDGKLAVIAKHFPGRGSSDRPLEAEIPTLRKSLEQLKQIELAPFFSATNLNGPAGGDAEGLLLSHIRIQGLQGNIRDTTRPVSFDRNAVNTILALPEFVPWRDGGGVLVSENLGSPAVRKFFDPTGQNFDARQIARNALLAGNDLLYVDDFLSSGDSDALVTLTRTLEFFTQRYLEDASFAQRVNESVERILMLKYRLYPTFSLDSVVPTAPDLTKVGSNGLVANLVARSSATLLSPSKTDLDSVLPRPPVPGERMVFITDVLSGRQCATGCSDVTVMPVDALQNAVIRLYGPAAGGQVSRNLLSSYSYMDLWMLLNKASNLPPVESDLQLADWVVFSALNVSTARPESQALRRLLSERPELLRGKRIIVFAFNAPYYLDATDISKLTAYYALYNRAEPFVETAARILFQELEPAGASPVSVPGIGYDLLQATMPDPGQIIPLALDMPDIPPAPSSTATPVPTPVPTFKVGDTIPLKTGVILDRNGRPVPDGTVVRFQFITGGESGAVQTLEKTTVRGVARGSYRIERAGLLEIRVTSDPAINSELLRLDISSGESAAITAIVPTPGPTSTPDPTSTPTLTPQPTPSPTPEPPAAPHVGDWLMGTLLALGVGAAAAWLGGRVAPQRWGVRWGLCMLIGGLAAYTYLALDLPGSQTVLREAPTVGVMMVVSAGLLAGLAGGVIWWLADGQLPGSKPGR